MRSGADTECAAERDSEVAYTRLSEQIPPQQGARPERHARKVTGRIDMVALSQQLIKVPSATDLKQLVEAAAERFGERCYIEPFERGLPAVSYADLGQFTRGLRAHFDESGIPEGAVVAAVLPNSTLMALLFVAIPATGRKYLPMHPTQAAPEREYSLEVTGARAVILHDAGSPEFSKAGRTVCPVSNDGDFIRQMIALGQAADVMHALQLMPSSVAEIVFTSGSSGRPKGVELSHANLLANSAALMARYRVGADDRLLTAIPLVHAGGQCFTTLGPLWSGATTTVAPPDLAMVGLWKIVERYGVTWTVLMTAFLNAALARGGEVAPNRLKGVLAGGSAVSAPVIRDFESRFGIPIYQVYGLTEMSAIVMSEPIDDPTRRIGSVGKPLPDFQAKVVRADDTEAENGEAGEIWLAGPSRFLGYLNAPVETERKSAGAFVRTGDVGRFDEGGNLWVIDRKDNLIIVGGENIYPAEVENVVRPLASIEDVVVTAGPDEMLGQQVVMVYKERRGETVDPSTIEKALRQHLSAWKVPRLRLTLPDLGLQDWPRTSSGKIARPEVGRLVQAFCEREQGRPHRAADTGIR
jgi:acyl-CoA synthetase (AMP-forming)/AMP-acid ligase II